VRSSCWLRQGLDINLPRVRLVSWLCLWTLSSFPFGWLQLSRLWGDVVVADRFSLGCHDILAGSFGVLFRRGVGVGQGLASSSPRCLEVVRYRLARWLRLARFACSGRRFPGALWALLARSSGPSWPSLRPCVRGSFGAGAHRLACSVWSLRYGFPEPATNTSPPSVLSLFATSCVFVLSCFLLFLLISYLFALEPFWFGCVYPFVPVVLWWL
jgi:hypothetical protein